MRSTLQEAAQALRAGQIATAVDAGRAALDTAHHTGSTADLALAHAWLARALEAKNDGAGALDHALRALGIHQPIGVQLTRQLLTVLATSPDPNTVLVAHRIEVDLGRLLVDAEAASVESLRDLSVSLNNVATINQLQGQLNDALTTYTEAIEWYEQLDSRFGPPLSNADELAALRDARQRVAAALHTPGGEG